QLPTVATATIHPTWATPVPLKQPHFLFDSRRPSIDPLSWSPENSHETKLYSDHAYAAGGTLSGSGSVGLLICSVIALARVDL
ncbi:zinc finger C2H2 type AN1-like family protein, partial [Prunus dulcis]